MSLVPYAARAASLAYHPYTQKALSLKRKYDQYQPIAAQAYPHLKKAFRKANDMVRKWKGRKRAPPKPKHPQRSGGIVTRQQDVKTSKGKRPSKKAKKWKRFVNKVDAAVHYSHELCTFIESSGSVITATAFGGRNRQNVFEFNNSAGEKDVRLGVYCQSGANIRGLKRMINDVRLQADGVINTNFTAKQLGNEEFDKFYLKSCQITFSIANTSAEVNAIDSQMIYVDIYECISNMTNDTGFANKTTATEAWIDCLSLSSAPGGATGKTAPGFVKSSITDAGVTPYNAPNFGKYWKITKKTRLSIDVGAKINYTSVGYKGKVTGAMLTMPDQITKHKVKDFIIVVNPTFNSPTLTAGTNLAKMQWSKSYFLGADLPARDAPISGYYSY